jgi:hypothetical protein
MDRHHATDHVSDQPSESWSTPDALSHRQLSAWLQQAPRELDHPDPVPGDPSQAATEGMARLQELLHQHESLSEALLEELSGQGEDLQVAYNAPQLMALGALAAHLRLGLQALAASRR